MSTAVRSVGHGYIRPLQADILNLNEDVEDAKVINLHHLHCTAFLCVNSG